MPFPSLTRPADKPEIRYFFDPLCGWCYGFGPVLMRLYEELKADYAFVAHPGGMVVGERIGPLGEKAAYIKGALPTVEARTGARFGDAYRAVVEVGTRVQNSLPPSHALTALARLDGTPARTVPFAHDLLNANFRDGLDLADPAVLVALAAPYGYDEPTFAASLHDPDTAGFAQAGFTAASQVGVTGFPTLVLRRGQQGIILARGYAPYEQIRQALEERV